MKSTMFGVVRDTDLRNACYKSLRSNFQWEKEILMKTAIM
jgi:hypothetical protein